MTAVRDTIMTTEYSGNNKVPVSTHGLCNMDMLGAAAAAGVIPSRHALSLVVIGL